MQGGLLAVGGLLCDWRGEWDVLTDRGLLLSEEAGGGCLDEAEIAAVVRPEAPPLPLPPDRVTSRDLGINLPSL